ncbi:MAG: monovalent cation/H+ antiporter complex subunit F [Candidatus Nezhaarchaeales archaeon]
MDKAILIWFMAPLLASLALLAFRVAAGPTIPDRVLALDVASAAACLIFVLLALYYSSTFFIVVAVSLAVLGFIGTLYIAKYLEGREVGE